jgi:hypothetical protein
MQVNFLLAYDGHRDVHLLRQQAEQHGNGRFQLRRTNAVFRQGRADSDIVALFVLEGDLDPPRALMLLSIASRATSATLRIDSVGKPLVERSLTRCLPSVSPSESNSMVSSGWVPMHRDIRIWQAIFKTGISPPPLEIFTVSSIFDFAQADAPVTTGALRVSICLPAAWQADWSA